MVLDSHFHGNDRKSEKGKVRFKETNCYSSLNFSCFPAGLAYAEYMNGNIIRFEIFLLAYLQFENFETAACEINNLPTMLANQMAMILFVGHRFVIETILFDIEFFDEVELFEKLECSINSWP